MRRAHGRDLRRRLSNLRDIDEEKIQRDSRRENRNTADIKKLKGKTMSTVEEKTKDALEKKPRSQALVVKDMLEKAKGAIQNALPNHMNADRMLKIAYGQISRNKELMNCDATSLIRAVIQSSELGLEPTGILGHTYLIPYGNQAQLQIGYRGLLELAYRSEKISSISAEIVYEGDEFECRLGTERFIKHIPKMRQIDDDLNPVCCYALVIYKDQTRDFELLTLAQIIKSRRLSKSKVWDQYFDEMCKKTAIRKLCKRLPLSPQLQSAAIKDELVEHEIIVDEEVQ